MNNHYEPYRHIFERFDNLNLIVLIEDLRRHNVAWGTWRNGNMCPLAHGFSVPPLAKLAAQSTMEYAAVHFCTSVTEILKFIMIWDNHHGNNYWDNHHGNNHHGNDTDDNSLAIMLKDILHQRMEDADAMQAMLTEKAETALEHCNA